MKTKYLIILCLTFCNAYSQSDFLNFNQIKINEIDKIEKPFNSVEKFDSMDHSYYNGKSYELYRPITYLRPKSIDFQKTYVDYHNLKNDSLIKDISYTFTVDKNMRKSKFFKNKQTAI